MNTFDECPRCGDEAYERLPTYAHCVSCLYFQDYYQDSEKSYHDVRDLELYLESLDKLAQELSEIDALAS